MNTQSFFNFILSIPHLLLDLTAYLFEPLPYVNVSPIGLFTIGGISLILGLHLFKLVNPTS